MDKGAFVSILYVHAWRGMGFPNLMSTDSQLLDFERRASKALGILTQTSITLGWNTILVDFMVIEDPLEFIMILRSYYVYAMQYLVSMLFRMM